MATPEAAPRRKRNVVRGTTVFAVSVVAAVAAAVSFMHMHELAERAGEGWRAWLVPLAIDGLVVAASMTMVVRRRAGKKSGLLAWFSITLGITASLAANIAAAEPTLIGRAVAAWPPIALLLAYELLMDQVQVASRLAVQCQDEQTRPVAAAVVAPSTVPPVVRTDIAVPAFAAHLNGTASSGSSLNCTTNPLRALGDSPTGRSDVASATPPTLVPVPGGDEHSGAAVRQAARQHYLKTLADGLPCTGRELGDMFGMCERWGRYQIRAARRTLIPTPDTAQDASEPSPA